MKNSYIYILLLALLASTSFAQDNYTKTPKGALYHIIKQGNGQKVKTGDVITFNFTQKTDKDSLLGSSYKMGQPAKVQVQPTSQNVADLMEVFPLLSVNDSVEVKVPADSIFAGHEESRPPFFPKGSFLKFFIKIDKIQTLDEAMAERNAAMQKMQAEQAAVAEKMRTAEVPTINKYITEHNLHPLTTASGLKYVITTAGSTHKPLAGDTLLVNYAGRTADGKLFDSSIESIAKAGGLEQPGRTYEPIKFVVGDGQVIKGWDEGLLLMGEGSKAVFIIPSKLGYGERGAGEDIKPYSPLVFDIELVKIIPGVHKPKTAAKPAATTKKAPVKSKTVKKTASKKVTHK